MTTKLYMIPSPLGESDTGYYLPVGVRRIVSGLSHFIVENERTARRYLSALGMKKPIQELQFFVLNKHTGDEEKRQFITPLLEGHDMGLLSEAGVPGVGDPGSEIVRLCHAKQIRTVPLIGPSSFLLALMASGMNGQSFCFHGYLPIDKKEQARKIREIENAAQTGSTQIFMETPYRNNKLLEHLTSCCKPDTLLCIATELTTMNEEINTKTLAQWKKQMPDLHKRPTVFLIGKL